MERTYEQVAEYITERIDLFIQSGSPWDDDTLASIRDNINKHKMLIKEEARVLEDLINSDLESNMEACISLYRSQYHIRTLAPEIERMSVYSDAYNLWCRPGTYMIVD